VCVHVEEERFTYNYHRDAYIQNYAAATGGFKESLRGERKSGRECVRELPYYMHRDGDGEI